MQAWIDGNEVPIDLVSVQERKFGRSASSEVVMPIVLDVPQEEFMESFGQYYKDHAIDDVEYGEDADRMDLRMRELGWPDLATLWYQNPEDLCAYLQANIYGVLGELFGSRASEPRKIYYIFAVDAIRVSGPSIKVGGRAAVLD